MELGAFTSRLGVGQGRIEPRSIVAPSGDYVFVLGEDEPGRFFELDAGDRAEVVQDTDLTSVDLVRAWLRLRVAARATCPAGRERVLTDLAANVSKLSGTHQVGVRLELVVT